MDEVDIFHTKIANKPLRKQFDIYREELPEDILERNKKYVRWQDRKLNIAGKILLMLGFEKYGLDSKYICDLKYTKYGRPHIEELNIDFNISHSGEYVLCALSKSLKLGIDIEEKNEDLDYRTFSNIFNSKELNQIKHSENKIEKFYDYWTSKESVIKAIGKGLSLPLKEIKIYKESVNYDDQVWHIRNLEINELYSSKLATNSSSFKLNFHSKNLFI